MSDSVRDLSTFFRALRIARHDRPYHEQMTTGQAFLLLRHLSRGSGPVARRALRALHDGGWIAVPVIGTVNAKPSLERLRREGLLASKPGRNPNDQPEPPRPAA